MRDKTPASARVAGPMPAPLANSTAGRTIESYPIRLFAHDMAEIFGVSLKRFYALENEGAFDFARTRPTIGRKSWSRDRVKAYFDGTVSGLTGVRRAV